MTMRTWIQRPWVLTYSQFAARTLRSPCCSFWCEPSLAHRVYLTRWLSYFYVFPVTARPFTGCESYNNIISLIIFCKLNAQAALLHFFVQKVARTPCVWLTCWLLFYLISLWPRLHGQLVSVAASLLPVLQTVSLYSISAHFVCICVCWFSTMITWTGREYYSQLSPYACSGWYLKPQNPP